MTDARLNGVVVGPILAFQFAQGSLRDKLLSHLKAKALAEQEKFT